VPRFIPCYNDEERAILSVRPGLTGPGQIFYTHVQQATVLDGVDPEQHYATCELHAKLAIDLDYLRRRSLRFDLLILVRTVLMLTKLGKPMAAPQGAGQPAIAGASWPAPAKGHPDPAGVVSQLPRPAPPFAPVGSFDAVTLPLPLLSAELLAAAQAIATMPDDQPTLTEIDDLPALTEDDHPALTALAAQPADSGPDDPPRYIAVLEVVLVILGAALIGLNLVLLLRWW
jgi:hypothetical protein